MEESILFSIKKLLGIDPGYCHFDMDLIIHINSVFVVLSQIGVNGGKRFSITDEHDSWADYISEEDNLELIKTYMYLKVREVFDPPTIGTVSESLKAAMKEYEWRISVAVDPGINEVLG